MNRTSSAIYALRSWRLPRALRSQALLLLAGVWTAARLAAGTYVVNQAALGSSDSNPGTEQAPFKTVQHAADLAHAGDVVFVMAGIYPERVRIGHSGAAARPIVLEARPRRSVVIGGFELHGDYLRIDGFEITAAEPQVAVQLGGSHCEVLDNYIHDMMAGVAGTIGKPSDDGRTRDYSAVSHNHIAYNKIYHSEYGFILGGNDWLVENNEVERLFMFARGNKYDDCDYSRFFGKGCVERNNYFHGSVASEIRVAHVDCLQSFTVNGEIAQDLLFENNTCFDFHQLCMVESAPHLGSVRNWILRGNIVSSDSPELSGGWGPDIIQTPDVTIANNTICGVRWAAIGLRGQESTDGHIFNNILGRAERAVVDGDRDFSAARPVVEHNLTFATMPLTGGGNIQVKHPLFADAVTRDFRLLSGSPAIHAGKGGMTIGALGYPNTYFVDPRHPAARDQPGWGYPAVPLASLSRACALANPGETILLRGGIYREVLRPQCDDLSIRAAEGEKVILSGADVITGWTRDPDGVWSAAWRPAPPAVLRDGRPWDQFAYDATAGRIIVKGGDPRLHLFEAIVRSTAVNLDGKSRIKFEGITVTNLASAGPPL